MARGDYRGRVRAESADEVGELARAFNQMATELATVDQEQRDLVATVSHELRTPAGRPDRRPGEPRRRRRARRRGAPRRRGRPGPAPLRPGRRPARAVPGRRRRRRPAARRTSTSAALLDETVADLVPTGRAVSLPGRRRRGSDRARRPGPAAPAAREPARQRRPAQSRAGHGPGAGRAWRRTAGGSRSPTTVRASRRPTASVRSSVSAPSPPTRAAPPPEARASAWPSPAGWPRCTAAPSASSTRRPVRRAPCSASTCRSTRRRGSRPAADVPLPSPTAPAVPCPRPRPRRRRPRPSTSRPSSTRCSAGYWPDVARIRPRPSCWPRSGSAYWPGCWCPYRDLGLAFFLVLLAAGGTVWWAAQHRRDPFTLTCLVLAALCTLPVVLLDAEWIVALCLLGRHRQPDRRRDPRAPAGRSSWWPGSPGRSPRCAGSRGSPQRARRPRLAGVLRACCCTALWSALAVLVFGLLFASADAVVAELARRPRAGPDHHLVRAARLHRRLHRRARRWRAAYLALNPPDVSAVPGGARRGGRRTGSSGWCRCCWWTRCSRCSWPRRRSCSSAATTTCSARTGLTYAEYVHQGFGQLTVATLLMLLVVVGRLPPGRRRRRATALAAGLPRPALRADAGRRRLRPAPDAALPGGLRLHPGPAGRRRLRGLARRRRPCRGARRPGPLGRVGAAVRARHRRGRAARHRRDQPGRPGSPSDNIDRYEETGKIDTDFLVDALRRRRPRPVDACPSPSAARPWPTALPTTTTGSPGTSAAGGPIDHLAAD